MVPNTRWSLIQAAQRGDTAALEELCAKYREAILSYLQRCGLKEDAEDVTQEVLVALVEVLPKVHAAAGSFRSLVFKVAQHKRLNFRRQAGTQRRGGDVAHVPLDAGTLAAHGEPDDLFDREWLGGLLRRCLGRLEAEYATWFQALQATVLIDRPQAEAARDLGVSPATMRKRVWRGRKQLGAYLREEVLAYGLDREDVREEIRYLASLLGPLAPDLGGPED